MNNKKKQNKVEAIFKDVIADVIADISADSDSDCCSECDSGSNCSYHSSDDEDYIPPTEEAYNQCEWLDIHAFDITNKIWIKNKEKKSDWADEYICLVSGVGAVYLEVKKVNGKRKYRYNWLGGENQSIDKLYIIFLDDCCEYITHIKPEDSLFSNYQRID